MDNDKIAELLDRLEALEKRVDKLESPTSDGPKDKPTSELDGPEYNEKFDDEVHILPGH